jgi:hypothetical protein
MIRLSKHTLSEMGDRRILLAYIEATLANPGMVVPDKNDPALIRSYKRIEEYEGRALRVVHRPDGEDIFVVTAHWDRGVKL